MIRAMVGKFSNVTKETFKNPKVLIFDSENQLIKYITDNNYEAIIQEVTGKSVTDVFEEWDVSSDNLIEFQKELKQDTINENGFRIGYILSYKDVSGFIPHHTFFKDVAYEKFYVDCINKYFQ